METTIHKDEVKESLEKSAQQCNDMRNGKKEKNSWRSMIHRIRENTQD
ncbi:hypothetical protein ACE1TF_16480 [Geomicrobium sp. JSM 1781026]